MKRATCSGNSSATMIHNCPKVLFISLPIFALLLKLLYVRRKQFYYVDHGIFSIHLYIFSFLILLILFGIGELKTDTGWGLAQLDNRRYHYLFIHLLL